MLHQVVIKLNRACNLRCKYCYYINENTVALNAKMPAALLHAFLDKYTAYCQEVDLQGTVAFHGGEPLLMGAEYLERAFEHFGFKSAKLRASLQTNGTLVDARWAKLLRKHNVEVGLSIDGPAAVHDATRVSLLGRGSHARVVEGLRHLQSESIDPLALCVVSPSADGEAVFNYLADLGLRSIDFLPPITHRARQLTNGVDLAGVERFLVDAFKAWVLRGDASISVRLFREMLHRQWYGSGGYSAIGLDDWTTFAVLEVDGTFARSEEFADTEEVDGKRRYFTDATVQHTNLRDLESHLRLENASVDHVTLPTRCAACDVNRACNGGNIATRIDSRGTFDNPGIHCGSFYRLGRLMADLSRSV